jgi:predicted dehydrogenase
MEANKSSEAETWNKINEPRRERPLRGAVIGYGFIAEKGHVPAYLERTKVKGDIEIVAIADSCEARRDLARQAVRGARIYSDYESLLAGEAGQIDFIDIAVPPCFHAEIARAAFKQGLHVLCEKPLATSVEDARSMLSHAVAAKRVLFPCHTYKHAPVVKAVRQVIESGLIGKVRLLTLNTYRFTHARGVSQWRPDWRRERKYSGGGIAMDHGSHTFYLAFEWLGGYPTSISAQMSTLGNFDTEDNFACTMNFPNGVATAQLTWSAGVRKVLYAIHGDKGAITVVDDEIEVATAQVPTGPDASPANTKWTFERQSISSNWMDASHVKWFNSLLDQFTTAIDVGDFAGNEARDSLMCVQLIQTAYESAEKQSCRQLPLSTHIAL